MVGGRCFTMMGICKVERERGALQTLKGTPCWLQASFDLGLGVWAFSTGWVRGSWEGGLPSPLLSSPHQAGALQEARHQIGGA